MNQPTPALKNDPAPLEPPWSEEAERALLGSVLIGGEPTYQLVQFIEPDDFYLLRNNFVWCAIEALYRAQTELDNLTVIEELRAQQHLDMVGGSSYITGLINDTPTYIHASDYAKLVSAMATRRRWFKFAQDTANTVAKENQTIQAINQDIDTAYRKVVRRMRSNGVVSGTQVMDQVWRNFETWINDPADVRGYVSGIDQLDYKLMGWRPGTYAIGGASSMGKSTLAGGLVHAFAAQGRGVFVPTEIQADRAFAKIASDLAGIPYKKLLSGRLNEDETKCFTDAFAALAHVAPNVICFDTERPTPQEIEAECARVGAEWLIVDSGTAMAYQFQDQMKDLRRATTYVSQCLQNIGRSGVITVAFWQIGRNVKGRERKVPQINDFKESGAIEEHADVALGLYRHDYYVARQMDTPDPEFPPGTGALFILKDRDGGDGDGKVTMSFIPGKGFRGIETRRINLDEFDDDRE